LPTKPTETSLIYESNSLDQNPAIVYLAGLSTKDSRRTMQSALNTIAELLTGVPDALVCRWGALRIQHTMAIRGRLIDLYKPATVNKFLSALRGVLKSAWLLGEMTAEEYQKAITIPSVKNATLPAGRELIMAELVALMGVCRADESASGIRDAAILAILYSAGLRRAEIVGLDLSDYSLREERLLVRGKGGKERLAWLNRGAVAAMRDWLTIRGDESGPLFMPINKSNRLMERRLTTQAIYHILKKRGEEAAVEDFSPHDFRRTFVSNLLDAGADISTVSKMAGHSNVQTTARYDRRPEEAKRRAADLLHVPYKRREE
jgi:site-specific recombinase XerD